MIDTVQVRDRRDELACWRDFQGGFMLERVIDFCGKTSNVKVLMSTYCSGAQVSATNVRDNRATSLADAPSILGQANSQSPCKLIACSCTVSLSSSVRYTWMP